MSWASPSFDARSDANEHVLRYPSLPSYRNLVDAALTTRRKSTCSSRSSGFHSARGPTGSVTAFPSARCSPMRQGEHVSPFLLLDYAGPADFTPTAAARRGRASASRLRDRHHRLPGRGRAPRLHRQRRPDRPGRRAVDDGGLGHPARGIPLARFTQKGGTLEMVQLWVNLPAQGEECRARAIRPCSTPRSRRPDLPDGAGTLRVIAGDFEGHKGPARTFTPMTSGICAARRQGGVADLAGWPYGGLVVLRGTVPSTASDW